MKLWLLGLAALLPSGCGGRIVDNLCTPPELDETLCSMVDGLLVCPMPDGTQWEHLASGVWLHLSDVPRVLCDVAPDGRIIARSP
jgi:hypothetical protein